MLTEGILFADRYQLIRQLGRGGFSEVWLALDVETSVQIAIKVYASETGLNDAGLEIFRQEFALVFDLNHTNLLRPTYFGTWQKRPFLIMPLCQNGSAFKFIERREHISEKECWKLLRDVAAGLAYMHSKKPPLIHQDIKPDNILISDEGRYMITDFGISSKVRSTIRTVANATETMSSGTMCYMGPERFTSKPKPITASDIWSLGAMMYELMTGGTPPFGNMGGVLQKNGADIPEIEEDYSQELKDIVYRCLANDPWDRPLAHSIETIAEDYIAGRTPTVNDEKPATAKQWSKFAGIAACMLLIGAGIFAYLHFSSEETKPEPVADALLTEEQPSQDIANTGVHPTEENETDLTSHLTENNEEADNVDETTELEVNEERPADKQVTTAPTSPQQPSKKQEEKPVAKDEIPTEQSTGFRMNTVNTQSTARPNTQAVSTIAVKFLSSTSITAYIFIDGAEAGPNPWKGVLSQGRHQIAIKLQRPGKKKLTEIKQTWTITAPANLTVPIDPVPFE